MAAIVVDASVVAKWYIPERDHEQARTVRDDYLNGRHELLAPALLPFEVVNALKYSGHYEDERLTEAATTLPEYGIELIPYRDAGPAAEIAVDLDITLYDASYLALAHTNEATVYTADGRLLDSTDGSAYSDCCTHIREYSG
ncbi:MAG: type II toxin-antitoxin system VapC family toxin [Halobacteriaceae archaeon]